MVNDIIKFLFIIYYYLCMLIRDIRAGQMPLDKSTLDQSPEIHPPKLIME